MHDLLQYCSIAMSVYRAFIILPAKFINSIIWWGQHPLINLNVNVPELA